MALDATSASTTWHPLLTIEPTPPAGFTAYWSLKTADMEDADTFSDLSGNDYHANSAVNPPTATTDYKLAAASAMTFNGSTDYLNIDAAVAGVSGDTGGTWGIWVKPTDATPGATDYLISFGDTNANEYLQLSITDSSPLGKNIQY